MFFRLVRWLYTRAWLSDERPSLLFDLATAQLIERAILLPGVTVLARLIARVRDRVAARLWHLLAQKLTPAQRTTLDTLLTVPQQAHATPLELLRRAAIGVNSTGMLKALKRLDTIRGLNMRTVDVAAIPPARLDALARSALLVNATTMARMPDERRYAMLLAFARTIEVSAQDDALDLLDALIGDLIRKARLTARHNRLRTLKDLDGAALQLRAVCAQLVNPTHADADVRQAIYATVTPEQIAAAVAQVKVPGNQLTDWNNPAQATVVNATYDALNRLTTTAMDAWNPTTSISKTLTTTYTYNDAEQQYASVSPMGIRTTVDQDAVGHTLSTTVTPTTHAPAQSGAQAQTSYAFYDPRGLTLRTLDPAGNQRDMGYDAIGRVKQMTGYTGPNGGGTALTSSIYYTDAAQPTVTTIGPAPNFARTDTTMDELGRMISETHYTGGPVTYPTVPSGALTTHASYDGQDNLLTQTDSAGHSTTFSYENTGWLTQMQTAVTVPGQGSQNVVTTYDYDSVGNLLHTTDANQHVSSALYDVLNRLTSATDALNHTVTYSYDGLGRTLTRQDPLNHITSYTYDNASRLLNVANTGSLTTAFTYNDDGQPLSMADTVGTNTATTAYGYDGLNRLKTLTNPQGQVTYGYDSSGRVNTLDFGPDAGSLKHVQYAYDGLDRPKSLTNWLNETLTYNYSGERLAKVTYPNGVIAKFAYDGAGQTTALTHQANGVSLFGADYTFDALGRPATVREKRNGTSQAITYQYDELSRMLGESTRLNSTATISNSYTYDQVGNRVHLTSATSTSLAATPVISTTVAQYDAADRLMTRTIDTNTGQHTTITSGYDANNNLLSNLTQGPGANDQTQVTYGYDSRDRLISQQKQQTGTTTSNTSAAFQYDGNDARVAVTTTGTTTSYLNDGATVLQEHTGSQAPTSYLYAPGASIALFSAQGSNPGTWYHHDPRGSVRATSTSTGAVQNTYAYDGFGVTTGKSGPAGNTRQFAGQQLDPTGLYATDCGYYDPQAGQSIGSCAETPSSYPTHVAQPAHHGSGLDAGQANQLGQQLGRDRPGGIGQGLGSNGTNAACAVVCQYNVTLVQQPDVAPSEAQREFTRADWINLGLDLIPVVGQVKAITEAILGYDITGRPLPLWQRGLNALFAVGYLHQLDEIGMAVKLITRGAGESAALLGESATIGERLLATELKAETHLGGTALAEVGEEAATVGRYGDEVATAARYGDELGAEAGAVRGVEDDTSTLSSVGCANSFSADTPVATTTGEQPISTLRVGDHVLAYNEATQTTGSYTVTAVLVHQDPIITTLIISGEQITTTPEHPFYTLLRGWVNAGDLTIGAAVRTERGDYGVVQQVTETQRSQVMYNLTVADAHTFFVGEEGWLVHNACPPGGYKRYDVDPYGRFSGRRAPGYSSSPADGNNQAHHIIQNEWALVNVPGYKSRQAPAILLRTGNGQEHTLITNAQEFDKAVRVATGGPGAAWSSTFREEVFASYRRMINVGIPEARTRAAINEALKYFATLGVRP